MTIMMQEAGLDPVTLAVLKGRLEQVADEMDATLYRSAFNPIIAEAHDACHGLYDAQSGDTLVQGKSGLPIFVGAMAFVVRAAARAAEERGGMHEGDVWLFNDPYEGGTHANDFKLVRPFSAMASCFAIWLPQPIGMMSAAPYQVTTIRPRPNAGKKRFRFHLFVSFAKEKSTPMCWPFSGPTPACRTVSGATSMPNLLRWNWEQRASRVCWTSKGMRQWRAPCRNCASVPCVSCARISRRCRMDVIPSATCSTTTGCVTSP